MCAELFKKVVERLKDQWVVELTSQSVWCSLPPHSPSVFGSSPVRPVLFLMNIDTSSNNNNRRGKRERERAASIIQRSVALYKQDLSERETNCGKQTETRESRDDEQNSRPERPDLNDVLEKIYTWRDENMTSARLKIYCSLRSTSSGQVLVRLSLK